MNKTEIAKIKRRLTPDGRNPIVIRGWYVNGKKAVISQLSRDLMSLTQTECEKYTQIFKRVLSGDFGRNLSLIRFPVTEVMDGQTHDRLMRLTSSALTDEDAINEFMNTVLENTKIDENYLILLMHDTYDLDYYNTHGDEGAIDNAMPSNILQYVICAMCPVKQGKPTFCYDGAENDFVTRDGDWLVSAPTMGFMFPTLEDGAANISQALFYSRDIGEDHSDFLTASLNATEEATPLESKEAFKAVLMDALEEECSLDVVQSVNEQLIEKLEENKKDKNSDPAVIGGKEISELLTRSGVSDDRADAFRQKFEEEFGQGAELPLARVTDDKQFEVKTGDVTVKVSPRQASLIETRVIDGVKYIMIPADDGVTVNGISIDI